MPSRRSLDIESPPSYRQAVATAAAEDSICGVPAQQERCSFLMTPSSADANNSRGVDQVETPHSVLTLTLVQRVVSFVLRQKHPLALTVHCLLLVVLLSVVSTWQTSCAPSNQKTYYNFDAGCNWTDYNNHSSTTNVIWRQTPCSSCRDEDDDSPALWRMTRRELTRSVRRAVRGVFLNPGNETSVFQILVRELTAHLYERDNDISSATSESGKLGVGENDADDAAAGVTAAADIDNVY